MGINLGKFAQACTDIDKCAVSKLSNTHEENKNALESC